MVVRDREHKRRRLSLLHENRAWPSKPVAGCLNLYAYRRLVKVPCPTMGRGLCGILHADVREQYFLEVGWIRTVVRMRARTLR